MDTILVVEDDPISAMLLRAFCEQEGYPVITAASGAEARAALREHAIALVLLDLRLPDVDGVMLMREIRQGERPPDVIITTAYAGRESAIAAIEAGAVGYIVKPLEIPRLRVLVESLLEQRRLRVENAALYQRAEREQHRLKALYEVANRLASVQDCWQILDLIVREATRLLEVEAAAIRLVEGEELVLRAWTESAAPFLTRRTLKIGESLTGCIVQTGEPISVCDLALDPRYDPTHKQGALALGFHAFLGVPLRANARILGTLSIYGKVPRSFQPDEIALLSALGDQASLGIDRARLFQQEQERRRHLEAVRAISEEITRELDLPILLGLVTQRAVDLLGAEQGMIRLWDETDKLLVPKAWTGGGDHRGTLRFRLGEGVAGTVAERRQGMIVNDFRASPYATKQVLQQTSHTAVLAEPLLYRGRLVGVVTINREQGMGLFTEEDQRLINLLASQAAIAIENARMHEATIRRGAQLETIRAVSVEITRELDLGALLHLITKRVVGLIGGGEGLIRLWDEDGQRLVPRAYEGNDAHWGDRHVRLGQGVAGTAAQRREGMIVNDFRTSLYAMPHLLEGTTHTAVLAEPLLFGDRLVGVLSITREADQRPFTENDRQLLALFAAQAAIAIENARLHAATVRRGAQLEALLASLQTVTSGLDLREILDLILGEAIRISGAPHVKVLLREKADGTLRVGALRGSSMPAADALPAGASLSGLVVQSGEPLFIADAQNDPRNLWRDRDRELGIVTYLGLPIKKGEEVLGVLTFNTLAPYQYTPEEIILLTSFAAQAAIAIENARLHEATRHRAEHLATLNAVSRSLTTVLDSHAVVDRILAAAQSLIPECACRLWRCTERENSLTLIGSVGMRNPEAGQSFRFREGEGLIGTAITTRRPVTSSLVRTDPRFSDAPWAEAEGLLSYIGLPLMYGEQVVGFLSVFTRSAHVFPAEEVDLLSLFAGQAAIALENARLFEETQAQRARLAEIFDSAVEGIFQIAPGAGFLSANPAFVRMLGYESFDDLRGAVGDPDRQLYVDPERRAVFHRLMATQGSVSGFDSQVSRKNGGTTWIGENTRVVKDAEGRLLYYEGFTQDISDRKQADQMKSDFVSFVTHQLRTPLAGIKWLLELASQEPDLSEDVRSYIADAREADERLVGLVNDLLDVSRLERGKLTITPKEVDLAALTQSVLDEMQPLIAEKGHRVAFQPMAPPPVWADPQLLRQVVLNLTSNAVKYTPPGGEIAIRLERDGEAVCWAIQDSGIGIPKTSQARLFEKFYRAENVLTIETEGTGLGLYLVRLILEQFEGRVWCESEEGRGSTFLFTVPLPGKGKWG